MSDVLIDGDTGEVIARGDIAATSGLTLSVEQWADRIRSSMADSVIAVLQVGADLLAAKAALGRGRFGELVAQLGLHERTAQRHMVVAANAALANPTHVSALPPAYSTLAELARLDADVLTRAIEAGEVSPDMERDAARELVARYTPKQPKNATQKGSGVEGSVGDGDAGPDSETTPATEPLEAASSDGADSHDVGRPEPEPDPAPPAEPEGGGSPVTPSGSVPLSFTATVQKNGGRFVELIVAKGDPHPPVGARVLCTVIEGTA